MKKALKSLVFLSVCILSLRVYPVYGDVNSIKLEYTPKPGTSTKYLMVMTAVTKFETNQQQELPPIALDSVAKVNTTFTQYIKDIDSKGNINMTVTYNDVSLEIEQGGEKTSIPLGNKLGGKTVHLNVSKDGKVLDMKGLEDIPAEFKDFALQRVYPQVNPYFPSDEVKIGDTWTQEIDETVPLYEGMVVKQKMGIDYTLNGFEDVKGYKCAVLGIKIKMNITGDWENKEGDYGLSIKSSGEGSGIMKYAYKSSKPITSKVNMDVKTKMRVGTGKEAQDSDINQQIQVTMEMVR